MTDQQYKHMMTPFDRITTGKTSVFHIERTWPIRWSILSNLASSFSSPKEHRLVVVGNHSNDWFAQSALTSISREIQRRLRARQVFFIQFIFDHHASQWHQNKGQNALGWRDFRVGLDDWIYFKPTLETVTSLLTQLEVFHRSLPWGVVAGTTTRLETFMTPDVEGRPPPHQRSFEELRAFYPEPGVLERLYRLKHQLDPTGIFDGSGTMSVHM